ncbi:MAG: outer rane autotransporter barrel protein [Phycisphaerales bacterium]|nr:outer rane autotransporter barrel protein [Phycisphaerales bacterium]
MQRANRIHGMIIRGRVKARLALGFLLLLPLRAGADTLTWTTDASGTFNIAANWSPAVVPAAADTVVFRRGAGANYQVTFPGRTVGLPAVNYATDLLRIGSNTVTLRKNLPGATYALNATTTAEAGRAIIVGDQSGDAAVLTTQLQVTAVAVTVGDAAGATGTLTVGNPLTITGSDSGNELIVGNSGTGTLNIPAGMHVSLTGVAGTVLIGNHAGSSGTVSVSGTGATLAVGEALFVGSGGAGILNVTDGGQVTSTTGGVHSRGAESTVQGVGSAWTISSGLSVGFGTNGALHILSGGHVTSGPSSIAGTFVPNGIFAGAVLVDGPGSTWTVNGQLDMPSFATLPGFTEMYSTLTVSNGGVVTVGGNVTGGSKHTTVNLDGGTLDLQGHQLGDLPSNSRINTLNLRSGTLKNVFEINGGAGLTKTSPATLTLDGVNTYTGTTTVSAGALVFATNYTTGQSLDVADGAIARLASSAATPHNVVLKTAALNTHASGTLDLTDNKLIIPGGDPAAVAALVKSGYRAGAWDGPGIGTTAATPRTSLGIARADDIGYVGKTFGGVSVAAGDVLVMYTLVGDANLDGAVDFLDLARLAQSYNVADGKRQWSNGDYDYNGNVDFLDLAKLAQNYNTALPGAAIPGAPLGFEADLARAFASVPEPSLLGLLGTCALAVGGRRRKPQ